MLDEAKQRCLASATAPIDADDEAFRRSHRANTLGKMLSEWSIAQDVRAWIIDRTVACHDLRLWFRVGHCRLLSSERPGNASSQSCRLAILRHQAQLLERL